MPRPWHPPVEWPAPEYGSFANTKEVRMQFTKVAVSLAVLATTLSFAAPAAAQSSANAPHWYAGGSFGRSGMKDACDGAAAAGTQCDSDDYSWRLLGGYQFNQTSAVEG